MSIIQRLLSSDQIFNRQKFKHRMVLQQNSCLPQPSHASVAIQKRMNVFKLVVKPARFDQQMIVALFKVCKKLPHHRSDILPIWSFVKNLEQRCMNPEHHVRKIVALREIYGTASVARAMKDAFVFYAFSCEYIANLLEQRARKRPEPGALHLTRRQDLLDLAIQTPDMSIKSFRQTCIIFGKLWEPHVFKWLNFLP